MKQNTRQTKILDNNIYNIIQCLYHMQRKFLRLGSFESLSSYCYFGEYQFGKSKSLLFEDYLKWLYEFHLNSLLEEQNTSGKDFINEILREYLVVTRLPFCISLHRLSCAVDEWRNLVMGLHVDSLCVLTNSTRDTKKVSQKFDMYQEITMNGISMCNINDSIGQSHFQINCTSILNSE